MDPVPHVASIDSLLEAFDLSRVGDASEATGGTLNGNYRVPTSDGPRFARCYRADLERERVEHKHAITRWVADRGAPAVAPLLTSGGESVQEIGGRLWALFPWVNSRGHARGKISPNEAAGIGRVHGQIQAILAQHPASAGASLKLLAKRVAWDTTAALESVSELIERATDDGASSELLDGLVFQRDLLQSEPPREFAEFDWLPSQLLHGDFHDQQILLSDQETVAGVVDWEMTRPASRVWELVRSLQFSRVLETPLLEHYLRGYCEHVTLTEQECRAGIEFWWQNRLHGTWATAPTSSKATIEWWPSFPRQTDNLRAFADPAWRTAIADRFVAAAT